MTAGPGAARGGHAVLAVLLTVAGGLALGGLVRAARAADPVTDPDVALTARYHAARLDERARPRLELDVVTLSARAGDRLEVIAVTGPGIDARPGITAVPVTDPPPLAATGPGGADATGPVELRARVSVALHCDRAPAPTPAPEPPRLTVRLVPGPASRSPALARLTEVTGHPGGACGFAAESLPAGFENPLAATEVTEAGGVVVARVPGLPAAAVRPGPAAAPGARIEPLADPDGGTRLRIAVTGCPPGETVPAGVSVPVDDGTGARYRYLPVGPALVRLYQAAGQACRR